MNYEELINTVSAIVENDNVYKNGLTLVYELPVENHKKMDEHLFYKSNPINSEFVHRDEIEVEIGGVTIKLIKKAE
jgi:hypothetical protein